jgi:hypothetical protein
VPRDLFDPIQHHFRLQQPVLRGPVLLSDDREEVLERRSLIGLEWRQSACRLRGRTRDRCDWSVGPADGGVERRILVFRS